MVRIELTRQEMLDIQAHSNAMQSLRVQFQPLLDLYNRHSQEQEKVVAHIRKRVKDLPDVPLAQWDFSKVDPVTYEGPVEVPGPKKGK